MPKPDWPTAAPFVPETDDLEVLRAAAQGCRGCPLHEQAALAGLVSDLRVAATVLG